MKTKDKITNDLIILSEKLRKTLQLMNEESALSEEAKALEKVILQIDKIINNVDNKTF